MLTPALEKMVLSGQASFNTFVAGGSEKAILNVPKNKFIIIVGLTYFSSCNSSKTIEHSQAELVKIKDTYNTQLRIFSAKSFNTFLFRNDLLISPDGTPSSAKFLVVPFGSTKIDTYLVHETDVSFTFSYAGAIQDVQRLPTDATSVGYAPPIDYGKQGQVGALAVRRIGKPVIDFAGNFKVLNEGLNIVNATTDAYTAEFNFPVDTDNRYLNADSSTAYPIVNVSYVEIQGTPNNISATL